VRNQLTVVLFAAGAALGASTIGASGQQADAEAPAESADAGRAANEISLVYEREVFTYRGSGRREPFWPLTNEDEMGPRFEELTLQGIIYSTGAGQSLALLAGGDGRIYRVRTGDVVGDSRVIEIGPLRVVLAVESFGNVRREMLELTKRGGAR